MDREPTSKDSKFAMIRVVQLNVWIMGTVCGLIAGVSLFVATNWLVIRGGANVGAHLRLLRVYFPGYSVTVLGSFVGFAYAAVTGFVAGGGTAAMYNFFVGRRETKSYRP